jgi:hypothetical protein
MDDFCWLACLRALHTDDDDDVLQVGMEFWARWAHRALWHASLWDMHESHHRPRDGPFELNDVFAIVNAVPAMSLLAYGFFNRGLVPGLCFGAVSHMHTYYLLLPPLPRSRFPRSGSGSPRKH